MLDFIRSGKPVEKAYIESFNSLLRKECLNAHWFETLEDARRTIQAWWLDYNWHRPHGALDAQSPQEFLRALGVQTKAAKRRI